MNFVPSKWECKINDFVSYEIVPSYCIENGYRVYRNVYDSIDRETECSTFDECVKLARQWFTTEKYL